MTDACLHCGRRSTPWCFDCDQSGGDQVNYETADYAELLRRIKLTFEAMLYVGVPGPSKNSMERSS